ncbi:hypothetical protein DOTSEDRAFT_29714 [Dothistroma septosporum NZE10]|uniref:Uncharacterized protein n=1 Tax=Dothistroma septosporum (strain NZE10 / CBS 128990) TaxID=675120 RepID=M2YI04_DOTSN|nr:hypothetical protein DOTSEDRAFT_29714 [Dothistroma septosporum NZE10]
MSRYQCFVTAYSFEELRDGIESLATTYVASADIKDLAIYIVAQTTDAHKQDLVEKSDAAAVHLHDIHVPEDIGNMQSYVEAAGYYSLMHGNSTVGEGPLPVAAGMAKEEAKRIVARAGTTGASASHELPAKKKPERRPFWNDLLLNDFLLQKYGAVGKQGTYLLRILPACPSMLLSFEKDNIRPTITLHLNDQQSLDDLPQLAAVNGHYIYFSSPAVPALLKLIYIQNSMTLPYKSQVSAKTEIRPAHLRDDIARCFVTIQNGGMRARKDELESWSMDANKEEVKRLDEVEKGNEKTYIVEVLKLSKKNPSYVRAKRDETEEV